MKTLYLSKVKRIFMHISYVDCISNKLVQEEECLEDCLMHRVLKIELDSQEPKVIAYLNKIKKKTLGINFNAANSAGNQRQECDIKIKSFLGLIAEQVVFDLLVKFNKQVNQNTDNVKIKLDDSNSAIDQVDIKIQKSKYKEHTIDKLIEVRSSFPFKTLKDSVCGNFDILGPYSNRVKSRPESEKDYYLRVLFDLNQKQHSTHWVFKDEDKKYLDFESTSTSILKNVYFDEELILKKPLIIYFVGCATREMMNDECISYQGNMKSKTFNASEEGSYKKIKLKHSLDAISCLKNILAIHSFPPKDSAN